MKKSASISNTNGRTYWRSLDHMADTPEFNQWLEREFPEGASELSKTLDRRHFVKIMSASFMLAGLGLTGCRRPEETILPFAKMPEDYVHGVSKYYASAMPTQTGAIPLVVRAHEGRPVKVSGNPDHPTSNGGTNLYAQASLLDLYDPDRSKQFLNDGVAVSRDEALAGLGALASKWDENNGEGVAFLSGRSSSPSRKRLQEIIADKYPEASWHVYEPVDSIISGLGAKPRYSLENAEIILSLDSDFLGSEEDSARMIQGFAEGRKIESPEDHLNRLYVVEGLMTLTGSNADHRLRVASSQVAKIAAEIATEVSSANDGGERPTEDLTWVQACAWDIFDHKGKCAIVAGERQPLIVHQIAAALNVALGNVGETVVYEEVETLEEQDISALVQKLRAGQVQDLVILDGNPSYNAPADYNWSEVQGSAANVVRFGFYDDETSEGANWQIPAAHYLESWGDAVTSDGTLVPVQPLIRPLFDGVTELEFLARLAGEEQTNPHEIVQATFREIVGDSNFDYNWKRFLHDGYAAGSADVETISGNPWSQVLGSLGNVSVSAEPSEGSLEINFYASYAIGDGRSNNNGWLQELPDPITKLSWDNAVLVSSRTAKSLGVSNGDMVQVSAGGVQAEGPIWIQAGMADYTLGLALGYGRTKTGRVGEGTGFNFYTLRNQASAYVATGASAQSLGRTYELASVQDHWSMTGRAIVREANLSQYEEHPDFATSMGMQAHTRNEGGIYQHPYQQYEDKLEKAEEAGKELLPHPIIESQVHQWGMTIDLNSCVGCSACVIACQSENNIPIVGKDQVAKGREMHWIRIDRYFAVDTELAEEEQIDNPQWFSQPMGCQHCETAPCETVCPVNATVHDEEGLNVMAYNRCVGTRYCSNNCPYKVRRFNFFDYNRRPLNELYKDPITAKKNGKWELESWFENPERGSRPEDEWQLSQLIKNPDVSVRMRGVMEKCSYCVQRIEGAKIAQKVKARNSDNVEVPDGALKTACQEVCPAEAIVFGNLLDPESRVSRLKANSRNYEVLGYLDTRPRTTYLARVRNPNPAMPDYYESPYSLTEYSLKNGDPFAHHEGGNEEGAEHEEGGEH